MTHYSLKLNDNSYGLNYSGSQTYILLQLNDGKTGEQLRVSLNYDESIELADKLNDMAKNLYKD